MDATGLYQIIEALTRRIALLEQRMDRIAPPQSVSQPSMHVPAMPLVKSKKGA